MVFDHGAAECCCFSTGAVMMFTCSDKKNKRIESREIRDSDSGSSLEAYIEGIFVSSMEQMGIFGVQERSLIEQIA
jgi:hypothetical protein